MLSSMGKQRKPLVGRLVLGAGLGAIPQEFTASSENGKAKPWAEMLNEGFEILAPLLGSHEDMLNWVYEGPPR